MGKEQDLLDASRGGQFAIVDKILNSRIKKSGPLTLTSLRRLPGPNTTDPRNGFTCLHYASLNGHKDIVNLLLEHGANPNIVDHNGSSPLHLASWTGDYEVVNMLITTVNQKADINLKNKDNETALHSACQYGHTPVVSLLLSKGADPFIRNIRSETALDLSAQYGRLDTIELLLRMRFDLLKDYLPINRDPLIHSMHKPSMVRHSPLHLASRNGHKAVVKLLLDLDFDVDYLTQNGTALHEAVLCGKVEVVRLLLDAGTDLFLENENGQKVEELLNGLNTSVAKQTMHMINEHVKSMANNRNVASSPVSEAASLGASNSFCDQSEDLTLVDSMLNEDIAMYQHDFEDLMDETDVQCISPPPGYTDFPPQTPQMNNADDEQGLRVHLRNNLDIDCVSPSSSLFSSSILSELASIFDEHLKGNSTDELSRSRWDTPSQEFTEDPFGFGLKPSTSFTLADHREKVNHRTSATSDIVAHHQSFDAVFHLNPLDSNGALMSTSLNSQSNDFGKLSKRYQTDSSREGMQSSNYSLSSTTSQSSHQIDGNSKPRPPKPPRKSIDRSKGKSLETGRALLANTLAKSDFNVDYAAAAASSTLESDEERSIPSQRQASINDLIDSDHSGSPRLNSVISNDRERKPLNRNNGNCKEADKSGTARKAITDTNNNNNNGSTGVKSQSITFTQSIDDFYMLYDQVAANSTNNNNNNTNNNNGDQIGSIANRDSPYRSASKVANKKHSNSLDNMLQDESLNHNNSDVIRQIKAKPNECVDEERQKQKQQQPSANGNPPSPRSAETNIYQTIEPLKQHFHQQIQPPIRRKRKKKQQPSDSCATGENQTNEDKMPNTKRDNWTLTEPTVEPVSNCNIMENCVQQNSPRKRSVAVWTVESGNLENSSLLANRVQVKNKSMTDLRKSEKSPTKNGNAIACGNGAKSEYYSTFCETLKLDRKGERENPFAGLCRGGLTPAKTNNPLKQLNNNENVSTGKNLIERKKKTVELSEARKSLRRQRNILSGRAESLTKISSKLSVYQATSVGGNESTSTTGPEDITVPAPMSNSNNIYATLRKQKKKCKSLNGDLTPAIAKEVSFESAKNEMLTSDSWNDLLSTHKANNPKPNSVQQTHQLYLWLKELRMEQYKDILISNGYDNLNFMDANVMDDSDLFEIGIINAAHRDVIINAAQRLPKTSPKLTKAEIKILTVPEWLSMLNLDQYRTNFERHGMTELRKVHNIWEVELETVLEIEKSGYRRRIMYSLSDFNRESILMDDDDIASWLTDVQSSNDTEKEDNQSSTKCWKEWKHPRQELVSGCCQYSVRYLGSTLVRELRGIDSTRASMGKLKGAHSDILPTQIPKIILSISCQGVQFRDFKSNHLICEHEIRNIHCICQDSEDLNYFAYITKDFESNNHYCHVFMSQQTDLVTEIILTLGQAFEIAYQIVLEQYNIHAMAANEMQIEQRTKNDSVEHQQSSYQANILNGNIDEGGDDTITTIETVRHHSARPTANGDNVGRNPDRHNNNINSTNGSCAPITGIVNHERSQMVRNESEPTESEVRKKATPLLPSSNQSDHHQSCEKPTTKKILKTLETDTFNDRDNVQSSISSSITEDIYAVVDKSRKLRKKSISETTKSSSTTTMDTTTSTTATTTTTTPSTTTGTIVSSNTNVIASPEPNGGNHQSEQRPVPPVRSTSTSERRPELKPKPPIRVASIQKPEVSPKPKNLSAMGTNSPIPNTTSGYGHRLCNIKPSIAARQAQLISCTSPQPPTMTPSPAPSH